MQDPTYPSNEEEYAEYMEYMHERDVAHEDEGWDEGCAPEDEDEREDDEPWDGFRDDVEADADALASCGWGEDEYYNPSMDHLEDY